MSDPLTIRERAVVALLARLQALPGITVERNRRDPVDADALTQPALNFQDLGHTPGDSDSHDEAFELQVVVDMSLVASTDAALGPALAALYGRIKWAVLHDSVSGAFDTSLSGLASDVRERGFDVRLASVDESTPPLIEGSLDLVVEFRTADGDPYSL